MTSPANPPVISELVERLQSWADGLDGSEERGMLEEAIAVITRPNPSATSELVETVARAAFAAHHYCGPTEDAYEEPNWDRGGFKTERVVWDAVARAALEASGIQRLLERDERMREALTTEFSIVESMVKSKQLHLRVALAAKHERARTTLSEVTGDK